MVSADTEGAHVKVRVLGGPDRTATKASPLGGLAKEMNL
jgi:hypothetical protein